MSNGATETPVLHLGLGTDARQNRNWQILDAVMARLGKGTIIPEDVLIQGNLEVTGDANVHGQLTAGTISTGLVQASDVFASGSLVGESLNIHTGPVTLPNDSLIGVELAPDAGVYTAGINSATGTVTITPVNTPVKICSLQLPAAVANRWLLLIIQLSVHYINTATGGGACQSTFTLRADAVDVQTRSLQQVTTADTEIDVPLTMIRLEHARAPVEWSVWGTVTILQRFQLSVNMAAMYGIQLR
jgi:hypothetical protein